MRPTINISLMLCYFASLIAVWVGLRMLTIGRTSASSAVLAILVGITGWGLTAWAGRHLNQGPKQPSTDGLSEGTR